MKRLPLAAALGWGSIHIRCPILQAELPLHQKPHPPG